MRRILHTTIVRPPEFHNTGLYNIPGRISYPAPNVGIYEFTQLASDVGKFKTPTLRYIAITAPYMHVATINEVLDHYAAGGRTIASGPHSGNGRMNPNKDSLIGRSHCQQDREDLIVFLISLTDATVLHEVRFSDPWDTPH